jgi:hypothetical protein
LSGWIRIYGLNADMDPDPGEQKRPVEKSKEFSCFEVLDVLF